MLHAEAIERTTSFPLASEGKVSQRAWPAFRISKATSLLHIVIPSFGCAIR